MWRKRPWSLWIGNFGPTAVYLHAAVIPVVLVGLYLGYLSDLRGVQQGSLSVAAIAIGIWLLSLIVHETGHLAMARALACETPEIVLGPVGNLVPHDHPRNVRADFLVALAGWTVQWLLCTVFAACLLLQRTPLESVIGLLHPFRPELGADGFIATPQLALRMALWLNWCLLLLHSLPVWPFDGFAIFQYGLLTWFPDLSRRTALAYTTSLARALALALVVCAWILREDGQGTLMPTWLPLLGLAAVLYWHSRIVPSTLEGQAARLAEQHRHREGVEVPAEPFLVAADEDTNTYADASSPSWWQRQQQKRREVQRAREAARREREQAENERVDDILRRVHDVGMEGLTREERSFLQRVSERWRSERWRTESEGGDESRK